MKHRLFRKGSLSFSILITVLLFLAIGLTATFIDVYLVVLVAPVLAGFVTGFYAKGGVFSRGKAAFKGVLAGSFIISLLSFSFFLLILPQIKGDIWASPPYTMVPFIVSPVFSGALGFLGGVISTLMAKPTST